MSRECLTRTPQWHSTPKHRVWWWTPRDYELRRKKPKRSPRSRPRHGSNMYLMHRLSDMDALGDEGSKLRAQALGLLQDTDTKIFFGQAKETVEPLQQFFGLNSVEALLTQNFMPGDALFRVGREEPVVVAITPTPEEHYTFKTDTVERSL